VVKWFIKLSGQGIHKISSHADNKLSGQAVHKLSCQAVHKLSGQVAHELSGNPVVNPIPALCTATIGEFFIEHAVVCGAVHLASSTPPVPYFFSLPLFHQCDGCLEWGLMAGGDLPAMGAVFHLGAGWPQWKPLGIPGTHLPLKRGSWLIHIYDQFLYQMEAKKYPQFPSRQIVDLHTVSLRFDQHGLQQRGVKNTC